IRQADQVNQFLVGADLNAETFWFEPLGLEIVEFSVLYQDIVNRFYGIAGLAVSGIDYFELNISQSLVHKSEFFRGGPGQVEDPVFNIGSAVVDNDLYRLIVAEVGHPYAGSERKGLVGGGKLIGVILFAAGCRGSFKLVSVKRCLARLNLRK